ncbi:MAG TPA: peptide-N4-asparagine amidase [Candidatus Cybelea sp.]|jgi:hypothetical protein|nr:peptide-N4-asparagine amidase [Candidatus Cybelea sp.]
MTRSRRLSLSLWCIAAIAAAGCRGGSSGIPSVAAPAAGAQARTAASLAQARVPVGTAGSPRIGTSNTVTADMPVARPDTTPCSVTLFRNFNFKNFSNKTFTYAPPASCPGPWAKVVFNLDLRVTKGTQYDRTGIIWVDGAVIYFGTTAEPSSALSPHWHVERDVTDLSALFKKGSQGQVELWNCYCPPTYNGYQHGTAWLQFYPANTKYPAPRVADDVLGVPYSPPLGGVATIPQSSMSLSTTLPHNIVRAYLDLYLQSQSKEEQWFMCVPDEVWRQSDHELGFCRGTAFREGVVSVDGQPAGLAPIYPWIFTGGIDPYLWFPIPGVQTLDFTPYRVDLTPFAGVLSAGSTQTVDVSVFRAFDYFSGAGDLLLYRDHNSAKVTGAVTQNTLTTPPELLTENHVKYGTGVGLFGGPIATGDVVTRSRNDYTIAGYVQTAAGKTSTTVASGSLFTNDQSFDYAAHHYVQLMSQNTHVANTTTTQNASGGTSTTTATYDYPLSVSYPILPRTTGYRLPVKIYQGYRLATTGGTNGGYATTLSNTVKNEDTMLFDPNFNWIGVRNGFSLQLYTYASKRPMVCYGREIKAKNNVVTVDDKPGCSALPPPRRKPQR